MGLAEQIRAGAKLQRSIVTVTTDTKNSGSVNLGASYALLAIQSNIPCRFRLYDNLSSLEDLGEVNRPFTNLGVSSSVALVGDFSMSVGGTLYTIDPIMYGVTADSTTQSTYYRITENATPAQIQITRYLLEDVSKPPAAGTAYTLTNRRSFDIKVASLNANATASGTFANSDIPQTYLLVSASVSGADNYIRLRLYSTSSALYDTAEKARPFETEPTGSSILIVDAFLSGSETTYFVPKIIGANLQNMGSNLTSLRINSENLYGENELYYIVENKRNIATQVTASLHFYALED